MKTSRELVYKAIDSERNYQDSFWPQAEWDGNGQQPANPLTIGEFVLLIDEYTSKARDMWTKEKKPENLTLEFVRKIAGIAVNCMEQHGAPERKGFEKDYAKTQCPDCGADVQIIGDKLKFLKHNI